MIKNVLILICAIGLFACTTSSSTKTVKTEALGNDIWYKIFKEPSADDTMNLMGFINQNGDTVVPLGKYPFIFTDTFQQMAIVYTHDNKCVAIDKKENELFEVYWFDNGPDYVEDGLFRIKKGDKIGYANVEGQIIIQPQYKCANPFEKGKAQVAYECDLVDDGEHTMIENAKWFNINKKGQKVD
jgi:hypothetical protein